VSSARSTRRAGDGWNVAVEARSVRWEVQAARLDGEPVVAADGPAVLDPEAARVWTTYYLQRYADGVVIFSLQPPDVPGRPEDVSPRGDHVPDERPPLEGPGLRRAAQRPSGADRLLRRLTNPLEIFGFTVERAARRLGEPMPMFPRGE
jgi:hypothetical protein